MSIIVTPEEAKELLCPFQAAMGARCVAEGCMRWADYRAPAPMNDLFDVTEERVYESTGKGYCTVK